MGKTWGASQVRLSSSYLGYLKLNYVLEDLGAIKGHVLDVGCGGGGFTKAIKHYRPDLEMYGADVSKEAIKKAKKDDEGVNFKVGDIYKIPFKNSFFDAVIATDVLEHLENPQTALKKINRVLKPKGVFSAFIPLEASFFSAHFWLSKFGWRLKEHLAGHIQMFSKNDVENLLVKTGFKVDTLRYSVHLLGQILDVSYYTLSDSLGKNLKIGLEEELKGRSILSFFKNMVTTITNLESQILYFFPGAGVHIKAIKK